MSSDPYWQEMAICNFARKALMSEPCLHLPAKEAIARAFTLAREFFATQDKLLTANREES